MRYEVVDEGALATTAAQAIALALRATSGQGATSLAVSGGKSSQALFEALCRQSVPWEAVSLYFVDERCVPPDHSESNYRLAREHLIAPLRLPAERVFRMEGERADREAAARDYEAKLPPVLGVVVVGLGEDGHTASLFPDHPLLGETTLRVATLADSPKPPPARLTLTFPTLLAARALFGVASGAGKREAVRRIVAGEDLPAARLDRAQWFLDRAAAGALP